MLVRARSIKRQRRPWNKRTKAPTPPRTPLTSLLREDERCLVEIRGLDEEEVGEIAGLVEDRDPGSGERRRDVSQVRGV
jgi:hypothetical protein